MVSKNVLSSFLSIISVEKIIKNKELDKIIDNKSNNGHDYNNTSDDCSYCIYIYYMNYIIYNHKLWPTLKKMHVDVDSRFYPDTKAFMRSTASDYGCASKTS